MLDAQRALLPICLHPDPWVRLWAAAHTLEFEPSDGVPVLESLAKEPGFAGMTPRMTLEAWRDGDLEFP